MKTIRRAKTVYRCTVCRTEYPSRRAARQCESGTTEPHAHAVGTLVHSRTRRKCQNPGRPYFVVGKVVAIVGPEPYDAEVLLKGFGIEKTHDHFFWYEVEYRCPVCRETKRVRYPGACLTAVPAAT